ncbi:Calx-beta domain-containing protein [Candidatus Poriferisodalis sp.]|uniref:Calx-beta domain-containing protein n=1 Tax=Candidatus Poriferisodalis sp. TaxID=3101277 RepID=UPI003B021A84
MTSHRPPRVRGSCRAACAAAAAALAAPLLVLVPLSGTAAAAVTKPIVTVTAEHDWIYEGSVAHFTIRADPAPSADLTLRYSISENHDTHTGDPTNGTTTAITISANQPTARVSLQTRAEINFQYRDSNGNIRYCPNGNNGRPGPSENPESDGSDLCSSTRGRLASSPGTIGLSLVPNAAKYTLGSGSSGSTDVYDKTVDRGRLSVSESSGSTSVSENGGTDTYTIALTRRPSADVTVTVTSGTPSAAKVQLAGGAALPNVSLTFTPSDWSTARSVTVSGQNDYIDNPGNRRTASISHTLTSADSSYHGQSGGSVSVTVHDDDTAGVTVTESDGSTTVSEDGTTLTDSYSVVLDTEPTTDVAVTASAAPGAQVSTNGGASAPNVTLTFTPMNWSVAQTVAVKGVDDSIVNPGNQRIAAITHAVASADTAGGYPTSLSIGAVSVTVVDDDTAQPPPTPSVSLSAPLSVTEGSSVSVTATLSSRLSQSVTIPIGAASTSTAQAADYSLGASIVISAGQLDGTATLTATDDSHDEVIETVIVELGVLPAEVTAGSPSRVTVSLADNDVPSAQFGAASSSADEDGGTHDITVSLSPAPASAITLGYSLSGTATLGTDYSIIGASGSSGTVSVNPGATSVAIRVTLIDDSVMDSGETVVVQLAGGTGYTVGSQNRHTLTIHNDDPPQQPKLTGDTTPTLDPTPTVDPSPGRSSIGSSTGGAPVQAAQAQVRIRLGAADPAVISPGESTEMTVQLARRVENFVRVFIETDGTADLSVDYIVEADTGDGWESLGENRRRMVFDLPANDTDAKVRVTSTRTSTADAAKTLRVTIGERTFAAGSVATIEPVGSTEIALVANRGNTRSEDDDTVGDEADPDPDGDGDKDSNSPDDSDTDNVDDPNSDSPGGMDGTDGGDSDDQPDADPHSSADATRGDTAPVDPDGQPPSVGSAGQTDNGFCVSYTVKAGDSLSGMALAFYRDATAWQRIYEANRGLRQADGAIFDSSDMIRAGWTLCVPTPIAAPSAADAADAAYVTYCVTIGDTLAGIARRFYGDSDLYNRIVLANRGLRQADGSVFAHGDMIRPGWLLRIPLGGA